MRDYSNIVRTGQSGNDFLDLAGNAAKRLQPVLPSAGPRSVEGAREARVQNWWDFRASQLLQTGESRCPGILAAFDLYAPSALPESDTSRNDAVQAIVIHQLWAVTPR